MGEHHHHGHDHDHDHAHHHPGHDNNLRSAYFHVLADALTSLLAIGALLAGRYLGLYWMDPAMGIVGALVIARWSWALMRDTAAILLDTNDDDAAAAIRARVEAAGAVVTDLHVWRVGPQARSEEHTSELQSLMRISYAVFCLKKKKQNKKATKAE